MTSNQNIRDIYNLLVIACKFGDLERVQELLPQVNPFSEISANDELAFISACSNGNLEIAQLLYQFKPDIDISAQNHLAFNIACEFAHENIADWLVELKSDIYSIEVDIKHHKLYPIIRENEKIEIN
jgi:ankyrin repeat protein